MAFPDDFLWGAATASYQIEGASRTDGRGDSIWDALCRRPGAIERGDTGDVACDHYHRFAGDVAIMREIGLRAYRFSVSWPRVMPLGTGAINDAGLGFYDRLVDALLEAGITPMCTLFHWDYPTELYCRGGWLNPESPAWFEAYTRAVVGRLGDRVRHWITLNEPQVFLGYGHDVGEHAPDLRLPPDLVLRAVHHTLLAHGRAVRAIRELAPAGTQVGWAPVGVSTFPDSESAADIEAARRATWSVTGPVHHPTGSFSNTLYADPVCLGHYPEDAYLLHGDAMPRSSDDEMKIISTPIDFYGFNLYFGHRVRADEDGEPVPVPEPVGSPRTTMGWPITPEALRWTTTFHHERYGLPLYITENGRAIEDVVDHDGRVRDAARITYLRSYLLELEKAIDAGADVRGYFAWSLLDNFEWAKGYSQRFGLVHVDYTTQRRIIKDSGHWYRGVIESNGRALHEGKLEPSRV